MVNEQYHQIQSSTHIWILASTEAALRLDQNFGILSNLIGFTECPHKKFGGLSLSIEKDMSKILPALHYIPHPIVISQKSMGAIAPC